MDALKTVHAEFNQNLMRLHVLTNADIDKMKRQFESMIDEDCNLTPFEYFTRALNESEDIIKYLVKDLVNTLALNSMNYVKVYQ